MNALLCAAPLAILKGKIQDYAFQIAWIGTSVWSLNCSYCTTLIFELMTLLMQSKLIHLKIG
jgi:hypothetical protein